MTDSSKTSKATASSRKPAKKRGAKAKKPDVKRSLSTDLIPIEEETWLLQPIAVTMMRHDYSLIQVRILVSIVESLQKILHGILNNERNPQLELFRTSELDPDGSLPVKIPFKTLGVDPNHYPQLRQSLKMLASIPVEIPYKTTEGRKYTRVTNLCDVFFPEERTYNKYVILKLDQSVAERLVNLDLGYSRLGKQIVFACKNRYTQRIYMFLTSWMKQGRVVIKTIEFRKMLRLENNYKKFSDFCRRVLDPAAEELKDLADKGFCDCWFEYQKKYDHGQRGGEPDEIIFRIYRAKVAMNERLEQMVEMQRRQFDTLLIRYFDFTPANAKKMSSRINAENYQPAMNKLMDLRGRTDNDRSIKDRAAYVYRSLDNLFKETEIPNTDAEEIS